MRIIGKSGSYYVANPFGTDKEYAYAKFPNRMAFLQRTKLPTYVSSDTMQSDYHEIDTDFYGVKLIVEIPSLNRSREIYVDPDGWMREPVKSKLRVYHIWEDYKKDLCENYGEVKIESDGETKFHRIL